MDIVSYVSRLPKPGETISGEGFLTNSGGKGLNQAVACSRLGGSTYMVGAIGDDSYGQALIKTLTDFVVDASCVTTVDTHSGIAVITVSSGQNSIIISGGANMQLPAQYVVDTLTQYAQKGDILLTQLETPIDVTYAALKTAKKLGMTTILNPAPAVILDKELYPLVDIITPNETETQILTGILPEDPDSINKGLGALIALGVKSAIITLGSNGIALYTDGKAALIPAVKVKAVDTTAAGDTFVGTLSSALSRGEALESACKLGVKAAALTCTRKGAAISIPSLDEVHAFDG